MGCGDGFVIGIETLDGAAAMAETQAHAYWGDRQHPESRAALAAACGPLAYGGRCFAVAMPDSLPGLFRRGAELKSRIEQLAGF